MPKKQLLITKASGEKVPFSVEKLRISLHRSGATDEQAERIITELTEKLYQGITTKKIYHIAFRLLKEPSRHSAAKYHLRRAIMELGPSGYPFEKFIGEILRLQGFSVLVGQIVRGHCVDHEVDVAADDHELVRMLGARDVGDDVVERDRTLAEVVADVELHLDGFVGVESLRERVEAVAAHAHERHFGQLAHVARRIATGQQQFAATATLAHHEAVAAFLLQCRRQFAEECTRRIEEPRVGEEAAHLRELLLVLRRPHERAARRLVRAGGPCVRVADQLHLDGLGHAAPPRSAVEADRERPPLLEVRVVDAEALAKRVQVVALAGRGTERDPDAEADRVALRKAARVAVVSRRHRELRSVAPHLALSPWVLASWCGGSGGGCGGRSRLGAASPSAGRGRVVVG